MIKDFFSQRMQSLFSKLTSTSFRWLVVIAALLFSFQNCTPLQNTMSGDASSQTSPKLETQDSGNGGVYGGLLPPIVPGLVQPGQKVVVAVLGGTGPFILKSQNKIGQITQLEERKFLWEIPANASPQKDVLTVEDAMKNQAAAPVEIRVLKQDEVDFNFGKSAVSAKGFTVMGAEDSSYSLSKPGCPRPGYLQVYNRQGTKISQVFPDVRLCEQFGAQISTDGERVAASGMFTEPRGNSTWSSQAGVTIYQMTDEGILIQEQLILSKRKLLWGWAGVGIHKDRLFISYAAEEGTGLVIEIYKHDPDLGWQAVGMVDFANSEYYGTSEANASDGATLVKFAEDSADIIVQSYNKASMQRMYLIFKESSTGEWALKDSITPFTLIPKEVRDLGTGNRISNFQIQGDQMMISALFANAGDHSTRDRVLIFKKNGAGSWVFQQAIGPTWADQSYNATLTGFVGGNYLVVYHEILHRLEVYRMRGDRYELYVDLSDVLMQNGFARSARFSDRKIIVPFYRSAYVFSLQ